MKGSKRNQRKRGYLPSTYQTVLFTWFGKAESVNQGFGVKEGEEGKP